MKIDVRPYRFVEQEASKCSPRWLTPQLAQFSKQDAREYLIIEHPITHKTLSSFIKECQKEQEVGASNTTQFRVTQF